MDAVIAAGAVPLLVALLSVDQPAVQEQAAGALKRLAGGSEPSREAIRAAGAERPLAALLRSAEPAVQEQAAQVLVKLDHMFWSVRLSPILARASK